MTSSTGSVTDTYSYDVFGALRSQTGTSAQPFRFTGEQEDGDVVRDLYYLRARYYDPALGRFWTADPFPGFLGTPQTQNAYPYAVNNPATLVDPYGLFGLGDIAGGLGSAGQAVRRTVERGVGAAVDYLSDPYTIASGVQFVSMGLMRAGCGTFGTNPLSTAACVIGTAAYIGVLYYKWNYNCNKVRAGEYSPLEAKLADILAPAPLPGGISSKAATSGAQKLAHYIPIPIEGCEPAEAAGLRTPSKE